MNNDPFARVLARCLDRIAAGETAAGCLAEYPQYADELAPLLTVAAEFGTLREYRVSDTARQRTHARLTQAVVARREVETAPRWPWARFGMPRLATGLIVALLCFVLTTGMVAASQPGDLAYGVRIALERAPVMLTRAPEQRARAELDLAARRLSDLDPTRNGQHEVPDKRAIAALVDSAERAAALSAGLAGAARADIAARLLEQSWRLAELGSTAPSEAGRVDLQSAAVRVRQAADHAQPPAPPVAPAPAPTATATAGPTATPASPEREYRTPTAGPTFRHAATSTPRPTRAATLQRSGPQPSATPKRPGPLATAQGPGANATSQGPGANATPQGPGVSATPEGPGANATQQAPGQSATPQGPSAGATPQGPGANATPQGSGPVVTPQGPGADATSQGSAPIVTPQGPGATPQAPGPGATEAPRGQGGQG